MAGFAEKILAVGNAINLDIKNNADKFFGDSVHSAKTIQQLEAELKNGGFVKVPFCSIGNDGKECYEKLKAAQACDIRGTLEPEIEKPEENDKCIVCNEKAKHIVWVARQY